MTSKRRLEDILKFLRRLFRCLKNIKKTFYVPIYEASYKYPIFYFWPFLAIFETSYGRLIFFIYDVFETSFFSIRHLFDIGCVQQNIYFTTVGISFQQLQNKRFTEYGHYCY